MGRLSISAVNQISGPWLISHKNLETLNDLFCVIDNKLSTALAKHITAAAKQQMEDDNQNIDLSKRISKLQRKYHINLKSATVTFDDGSTFEGKDIEEILNHVNSNSSLAPLELYIRAIHGNHENEFNLIINSNPGDEDVDFEYRIKCLDYDTQLEIKTSIDKWIRENKASQPLQIWSNNLVPIIWFIGLLTIFISYSNLNTTISKTDNYKIELKKEAQKIIENKNDSINRDSTLLLLLKLQSDYIPDKIKSETTVVYNKGAKKVLIASLILFFISLVRPRTLIGIGRKYNKYLFYKFWWTYIVSAFIILLFTTYLADSFLHFIK